MGFLGGNDRGWTIGEARDEDRGALFHRERQIKLGKWAGPVFYALLAAVCIWVFAYVSGLYPYLGVGGDDNRSAPATSTSIGRYHLGISTMLLIKGQTAFIEYDSSSVESEITLDVKPVTHLGYSEQMQRVKGIGSGTAEFQIEATGLYNFEHEPALGRKYGRTAYSVSWGAR